MNDDSKTHLERNDVTRFPTGALRNDQCVSRTRYDLIPPHFLTELAAVFAEGAARYGENNWMKGLPQSNLYNHALRHLILYAAGDRSEPHLSHAIWNIMAMRINELRGLESDLFPWDATIGVPCSSLMSSLKDEPCPPPECPCRQQHHQDPRGSTQANNP